MPLLSKSDILAVDDRQVEDIEVPEWGGEVRMRGLTGKQRDSYEASILDQRGGERKVVLANARAKLVALCAIDENGTRLFSGDEVSQLGNKSAVALERLFDAARRLSGMSERDLEKLTENFDDDPSADAISD